MLEVKEIDWELLSRRCCSGARGDLVLLQSSVSAHGTEEPFWVRFVYSFLT